jgi:hypothetical protein
VFRACGVLGHLMVVNDEYIFQITCISLVVS